MRLSDLKLVYRALQLYADDLGEPTNPNALIPVEWHERARMSDVELAKFDECDLEIFMLGEREEQLTLADRAPNADAFLQLLTYDLADLTMPYQTTH
jgi:hypothetical protein